MTSGGAEHAELDETSPQAHADLPLWSIAAPFAAVLFLSLTGSGLVYAGAAASALVAAALLIAAIFASVHHSEVLARRLGQPFGALLLALAVTIIEVGLIVSIMLSGAEGVETVARDTIFAAVMIVANGVVGICLLMGGRHHGEQSFGLQGATASLAVLGTLAAITLALPNFTATAPGGRYGASQLAFVGAASLLLYGAFVYTQTVRHRSHFLDEPDEEIAEERPGAQTARISLGLLIACLVSVVLLAKLLSYPLDSAVAAAGLPQAFVGVVVAAVVLLPEGIAATKAAIANRLQTSLNLALGSATASIGLTIPAVALVALISGQTLELGLAPAQLTLLLLTLVIGTITLGTGRTTVLQGAVHLTICAAFLMVSASP